MAVTENTTNRSAATRRATSPSLPLITAPGCPAAVVKAYDELLTNVDLAMGANAVGTLAVAGIDGDAAVATVAANLALLAAQGGDRTLLVDCNLQAPQVNALFGVDAAPGLAQLLGGEHNELRTLAQPTQLPTLGVIAAGTSGARSGRLARLGDIPATLLRLTNAADRVVLVAPAVLQGTDLLRLAPYVDGILLVAIPDKTPRESLSRARTILEKAEAPLIGAVLAPR